jgi:hypothetical protein
MLPKIAKEASNLLDLSLLSVTLISALTVLDLYPRGDALPPPRALSLAPYFSLVLSCK